MPPDPAYPFHGPGTPSYPSYVDLDTGRMLQAEPGRSYRIGAVNPGLVIPPPDGRWGEPAKAPRTAKAKGGEAGE